jgi:hypothetical protein
VPTVFTKNCVRLISHDAVIELFNPVLAIAEQNQWLSGEHFSVDGTLIHAWAGHKSVPLKKAQGSDGEDSGGGGNDSEGDMGQMRRNDTHEPPTMQMRACTARATRPANCALRATRSANSATA